MCVLDTVFGVEMEGDSGKLSEVLTHHEPCHHHLLQVHLHATMWHHIYYIAGLMTARGWLGGTGKHHCPAGTLPSCTSLTVLRTMHAWQCRCMCSSRAHCRCSVGLENLSWVFRGF